MSKRTTRKLQTRRTRRILKKSDLIQIGSRKMAHVRYGDGPNRRKLTCDPHHNV